MDPVLAAVQEREELGRIAEVATEAELVLPLLEAELQPAHREALEARVIGGAAAADAAVEREAGVETLAVARRRAAEDRAEDGQTNGRVPLRGRHEDRPGARRACAVAGCQMRERSSSQAHSKAASPAPASGTPTQRRPPPSSANPASHTGRYLAPYLRKESE